MTPTQRVEHLSSSTVPALVDELADLSGDVHPKARRKVRAAHRAVDRALFLLIDASSLLEETP